VAVLKFDDTIISKRSLVMMVFTTLLNLLLWDCCIFILYYSLIFV